MGCSASTPQVMPASVGQTREVITKAANANDKTADYHGFNVATTVDFDVSVPTNAIEGALVVLKVIGKLIQAYKNRSQFVKALEARVGAIQASVDALQKPGLKLAEKAVENLVRVLIDYKNFVQYITAQPTSLFEKSVNFFRAKSDLENLAEYDKLITRALADLSVPLATETLEMQRKGLEQLTTVSAQVNKMLETLANQKVLGIAKKCLTNEEAFTFWFECFPDRFQVPLDEFSNTFQVWLQESRGISITRRQSKAIVDAINLADPAGEEPPDQYIDAREANMLFSMLPANYSAATFEADVQYATQRIRARREEEVREIAEARKRAMKVEAHITEDVSPEEREVANNELFHTRFLCKGHRFADGAVTDAGLRTLYVFEDGALHAFGVDQAQKPIHYTGTLYNDFSLTLSLGEGCELRGYFKGRIISGTYFDAKGALCALHIAFELNPWLGYYEQWGSKGDISMFMEELNGNVSAISDDPVGIAIWRGTLRDGKISLNKKYIGQHFVSYEGTVTEKNGERQAEGKWSIPPDYDGGFALWELAG